MRVSKADGSQVLDLQHQAAMASRDTHVMDLCEELGVSRAALYNHVKPTGDLTERGAALLHK